jgi:hypothetical protein
MPMERPFAARRALLHPLWLASLALLVLNDHVFKGSGKLPGVLTGKLSDFAGLVVAPVLLAALLRLSSRRGLTLAHVATGVVFSAIKLSPAVARAFEALTELGPFPWRITVDPTDLVALPALLLSMRVLVPAMQRPAIERPAATRAVAIVGSLACAATSETSPPGPGCPDPIQCGAVPRENAALVIGNATDAERLVRVRPLKDSVEVDCTALLADPTSTLSRELFAPADAWLLQPSRGLPLQNDATAGCVAYLVDADGLAPTLLAWSAGEFPTGVLSTSVLSPDPNVMINMQFDVTGKLALAVHPAVFAAPKLEDPAPSAACAPPEDGVGVAWSDPLPAGGLVTGVESSPDDCHAISIENKPTLYVCVPKAAMPFVAGDIIDIQRRDLTSGMTNPETNFEAPAAEALILRSATHTVLVVRGNVLARYSYIEAAEPLTEPSVEADTVQGCAGSHDACGSLLVPLELSLLGDHVPQITFLRAGTSLALADGYGTLHVVRAEAMPIRDTACPPFARASRHYESVLVVPAGL